MCTKQAARCTPARQRPPKTREPSPPLTSPAWLLASSRTGAGCCAPCGACCCPCRPVSAGAATTRKSAPPTSRPCTKEKLLSPGTSMMPVQGLWVASGVWGSLGGCELLACGRGAQQWGACARVMMPQHVHSCNAQPSTQRRVCPPPHTHTLTNASPAPLILRQACIWLAAGEGILQRCAVVLHRKVCPVAYALY